MAFGLCDHHGMKPETHIGRYIGKMQWLMPFIGFLTGGIENGMGEMEENLLVKPIPKTIALFECRSRTCTMPSS
jgi:hypothetical protein